MSSSVHLSAFTVSQFQFPISFISTLSGKCSSIGCFTMLHGDKLNSCGELQIVCIAVHRVIYV